MASIEIVSGLEEGDIIYIESVMNVNSKKADEEDDGTDERKVEADDKKMQAPNVEK